MGALSGGRARASLPTMTDTTFGHQVAIAVVLVWLLQLVKRTAWFPWLNEHSDTANRIVSVVAAAIAAAGVTISIMGDLEGGGFFLIKWPPLAVMINGASHFILQIFMQEGIYRKFFKP